MPILNDFDFPGLNIKHGQVVNGDISGKLPGPLTVALISGASSIKLKGATSGTITLLAPAVAGSNTITFPAGTTDFSSTGGTNKVLQQTSSGAAITVATLATSNLSDVTAQTSWTPTDQSGASLSFTSVNARYFITGPMVCAFGTLTYPATGSGSVAKISLPVAVPNQSYAQGIGAVLSSAGAAGLILRANQGTSNATFAVTPGGGVLNSSLSGAIINFTLIYPVS